MTSSTLAPSVVQVLTQHLALWSHPADPSHRAAGRLVAALHEAGLEVIFEPQRLSATTAARLRQVASSSDGRSYDPAAVLRLLTEAGLGLVEAGAAPLPCGACPYCQGVPVAEYQEVGGRCWESDLTPAAHRHSR